MRTPSNDKTTLPNDSSTLVADVPIGQLFQILQRTNPKISGLPLKTAVYIVASIAAIASAYTAYITSYYDTSVGSRVVTILSVSGIFTGILIAIRFGVLKLHVATYFAIVPIFIYLTYHSFTSMIVRNDLIEFYMYVIWYPILMVVVTAVTNPNISMKVTGYLGLQSSFFLIYYLYNYGTDFGNPVFDVFIIGSIAYSLVFLAIQMMSAFGMYQAHTSAKYQSAIENLRDKEMILADNEKLRRKLAVYNRASVAEYLSSTMAHELGSPITAASLSLESMLRLDEAKISNLTPHVRKALNHINTSMIILKRMKSLAQHQKITLEKLSTYELWESCVDLIGTEISSNSIAVKIDEPQNGMLITADRVKLIQIIVNLLANSCEALSNWAGDRIIRVSFRKEEAQGARMSVIEIADSGPGLSEDLEEGFPAAFQTTKPQGSGIGLAISRMLAEEHFGSLQLLPGPDGGVVAKLTLPDSPPVAA